MGPYESVDFKTKTDRNSKYKLLTLKRHDKISTWNNCVARWTASLTSQKKGGGAYEYIRSFKSVVFGRFVSRCIACLHR